MLQIIKNQRVGYITEHGFYGEASVYGDGELTVDIPDTAEILSDKIIGMLSGENMGEDLSEVDTDVHNRARRAKLLSMQLMSGMPISAERKSEK